jgi:multidrug efflux pump subunit AcrA (membrane-fusion protein)
MSAPVMQRGTGETDSEMIPQDPPPRVIQAIGWLFIAMFFTGLVAAITVHLPETVRAPFVLVPQNGADPIQSPRVAVVSAVKVAEGEAVKSGQELFVLRSDEIRGLSTQANAAKEDLRTREQGLLKADSAYASQLEIKLGEISNSESEVKFREKHSATGRELVERMETLSDSGGISKVELIRLRLEVAGSEKDLSVAQRNLQQVTLDRQRMEAEHARLRDEQVAEIEKLKFRVAALQSDLENSQANMLSVRAPYDGVVISLAQRNAGSVVQNGQELCQLARLDAKPHARLRLNEAGLPKLAVGQKVRFFFDAFPYQRYGAVDAKLNWISPSAISTPEGSYFVGLASLEEKTKLKSKVQPRVGMRGEARVVVGRRTLMEYAFEPIRQLRENVRD